MKIYAVFVGDVYVKAFPDKVAAHEWAEDFYGSLTTNVTVVAYKPVVE